MSFVWRRINHSSYKPKWDFKVLVRSRRGNLPFPNCNRTSSKLGILLRKLFKYFIVDWIFNQRVVHSKSKFISHFRKPSVESRAKELERIRQNSRNPTNKVFKIQRRIQKAIQNVIWNGTVRVNLKATNWKQKFTARKHLKLAAELEMHNREPVIRELRSKATAFWI